MRVLEGITRNGSVDTLDELETVVNDDCKSLVHTLKFRTSGSGPVTPTQFELARVFVSPPRER